VLGVSNSVSPVRTPCLWLASLAVVLSPGLARAQLADGTRVLVMPFVVDVAPDAPGGAGASLWLGEAAALLLADDLSAFGVRALTRGERVEAFDRLQLPMAASLTRATMIRVGELIGATEVVHGEVRLGQRLQVHARVIQIGPGRGAPGADGEGDLADMFQVFDRLAEQLVGPTVRAGGSPQRDPDLPLEVFEAYVKGLVAASPAVQRRFLESALTRAPHDARVLIALWEVYTNAGEHEKALGAASAVPADSPRSRRARFAAARSLIELRRFDGAFSAIGNLDAERPDAALANAQGVIQFRRAADGAPPAASVLFRRAVDAEPGNPDFLFNLGYAHARAGEADAALTWLREAVRHDATDGDAHLVMSTVLSLAGRPAEAQREFDLARLLGTSLDTQLGSLPSVVPAGLERLVGQLAPRTGSRQVSATATERDQQAAATYHYQQGRRLFDAGRDREALDELKRAVYVVPYDDQSHLLIGRIYHRTGRLAEAINEFKVALWCRETSAGQAALGQALLDSGERDAARRAASRALALDPSSVEARALLARIGGGVPLRTPSVLPSSH
jgi:tetratricopeptide (TPR) repeat protein/TolB-like protein